MRHSRFLVLALLCFFLFAPAATAQSAGQDPLATESEANAEPPGSANVPPPPGTPEPARNEATGPAQALSQGLSDVTAQGQSLWGQVLLPMWQRVANALPVIVKAVLLLLFFWLLALLLSWAVRRLLRMTRIDERATRDWGLAGLLRTDDEQEEERSVGDVAGLVVKWTILLFGLVAFFQTLGLNMVAEPLQNVADSILGIIPSLLEAIVILVAYWILATLVKVGLAKVLTATNFDERAANFLPPRSDTAASPSTRLARLAFYLILLFGLPPFLEALGQTALVQPLTSMLGEALAFLPNIVAALLLFFIGKLIATICREVITNFVAASGADHRAETLMKKLGGRRLSEVLATVAYYFILASVLLAALDSLQIKAVSEPIQGTLEQLLAAVPLLFVALAVLFVGFTVAQALRRIVESFLEAIGFDHYPKQFGLAFLAPKPGRPALSSIVGVVVMTVILLLAVEQALSTLSLTQFADMIGDLIAYLPNLVAGIGIILFALVMSNLAARWVVDAMGNEEYVGSVGAVTRYTILFLGFSMGLTQLGVGEQVVMIAVAAVLFGAATALGISFGLGGREKAQEIIEKATQTTSQDSA